MIQDIVFMLRNSWSPKANTPQKELKASGELRKNLHVLVLPADKGNVTDIVETLAYENKIAQLLSYEKIYKKSKVQSYLYSDNKSEQIVLRFIGQIIWENGGAHKTKRPLRYMVYPRTAGLIRL